MTSIFARSVLAIAATATVMMIPAAAFAADTQPGAAAAGVAAAAIVQSPNPATRYCVIEAHGTGSIIDRKICRTRDAWLKTGFDPLAAKK